MQSDGVALNAAAGVRAQVSHLWLLINPWLSFLPYLSQPIIARQLLDLVCQAWYDEVTTPGFNSDNIKPFV